MPGPAHGAHAIGADSPPLELWAGYECTLNRVGDRQYEQLARSGHYDRPDDLDRLAALGIRTVRYPVLWERVERHGPTDRRWSGIDERMEQMRRLRIDPIVGLMHHGSGPMDTSLLDEAFPERLAAFAGAVAERYPWVTRFTPVNEPLTTARFSTLYGIWYPHARDDRSFLRGLLNQIRATRLSMERIRRVTPGAQLVQTEDLGHAHSTRRLWRQAAFENERRWLTFDLLTGRVTPEHQLWKFIHDVGITDEQIAAAVGDGCSPDLLGVNHYITSERWLDHRLRHYPPSSHGGNGRLRYADVEAVRAHPGSLSGPATLLRDTWDRYHLPLAVTEAHLGCTREEQMRWLHEMWEAAHTARGSGAEVRAVTAWAVLGTHDWDSLVTCEAGAYEPGLFDTRSAPPRATALATMAGALATTGWYDHPVLAEPGWWWRPDRRNYRLDPPAAEAAGLDSMSTRTRASVSDRRVVLITGARGGLGSVLVRRCRERGLRHRALDRRELDIGDPEAVARALDGGAVWAVVNAAGYACVDDAEQDESECRLSNVEGAVTLARACGARGIPFATFSSDLVFDGASDTPYVESDSPAPLNAYGRSKADAERLVLDAAPQALVVRSAWFFDSHAQRNFLTIALRTIASGAVAELPNDQLVSPTYAPHLADATLDLLLDGERGIWHLANAGSGTVSEIVRHVAREAGLDPALVHGCSSEELGLIARRPARSDLASERGRIMPSLDRGVQAFLRERTWEWAPPPERAERGRAAGAITV